MTKRVPSRDRPKKTPTPAAADPQHHLPSAGAIRETIESIVVAFILAFLFRTFEAEAFVIPTGSMAPTLMGRHKDVACPNCGCPYQVSASEEVDQDGAPKNQTDRIAAGTCPMCRRTASLSKDTSYNGDRILVNKLSYEFAEPQRWDVIVFRYPGGAATNYIKRLIGLPGETIRIQNGDIWVRRLEDKDRGDAGFAIVRKPPNKLLAMLQPVFDNDYMPRIAPFGWPARWYCDSRPAAGGKIAGGWTSENAAVFSIDGASTAENWLRYHHLTPSYADWQQVERVEGRPNRVPRLTPQLITDFTAYDTGKPEGRDPAPEPDGLGVHWVGDLAVACSAEVENAGGELILELRKGGRRFQCRFDLATGRATLSISGRDMEKWRPAASTSVRGAGRHDLLFSNCDDELRLWVDGAVVAFDGPIAYRDLGNTLPEASDFAPVGVASKGAAVRIRHLRVMRDIYYIAKRGDTPTNRYEDVPDNDLQFHHGRVLPDEPSQFYVDFSLESPPSAPDRFFALGDNSPKSADGRLWGLRGVEHWVNRDLLIGKALFIYWPHSWNEIPTPWFNVPFPYFPNFGRMGLVR